MIRSMAEGGLWTGVGKLRKHWHLWLAGPSDPKVEAFIIFPLVCTTKSDSRISDNCGTAIDYVYVKDHNSAYVHKLKRALGIHGFSSFSQSIMLE